MYFDQAISRGLAPFLMQFFSPRPPPPPKLHKIIVHNIYPCHIQTVNANLEPLFNVIEGFLVGHVVDHNDAVRPSVVARCDCPEHQGK